MRWLIAAIAFMTPVLLAVHFTLVQSGAGDLPAPAINPAALAELRGWMADNLPILERYAIKPGDPESSAMPHVALDRFERRGCDRLGNPWFTLIDHPIGVECGVLRREAGRKAAPAGHASGLLLIRLRGDWLYWEWRMPAVEPADRGRRPGP